MKYLLLAGILFPLLAVAHGGTVIAQKESGVHRTTIDAVSQQLHSGLAERINFELERLDGAPAQPFSHIWIRVTGPDESFLFAGNIHAAPEGFVTGLSYLFPQGGTYEFLVRFFDGEQMIAEAELPIPVVEKMQSGIIAERWRLPMFFLVAGLLLGIGLNLIFKFKNSEQKKTALSR